MLSVDKPYFMKNEEWYYYDIETFKYQLTDKAPQEAIDSYNKYYEDYFRETHSFSPDSTKTFKEYLMKVES